MNKTCKYLVAMAVAFWVVSQQYCLVAEELLFVRALRDYDQPGRVGEMFRRELEPRLFLPGPWMARLYRYSSEADCDEAIQIYSKPNGSTWVSYRRATPALTSILYGHVVDRGRFDVPEELAAVKVTVHEEPIPPALAAELQQLWRQMLPGAESAPAPQRVHTHVPIIIAFVQEDHSVLAGSIPLAAYDTPQYQAFAGVVNHLISVCRGNATNRDRAVKQLLAKMQRLKVLLK
jgi:hypothetical protein